jgi:hypothetical protein
MTSKRLALKVLNVIFVAVAIVLLLVAVGLPADWLLNLAGMSSPEFQKFALFILFSALLLIFTIGTSDSAP